MSCPQIIGPDRLEETALTLGLLPFFDCGVGLSIQELTPDRYWFSPDEAGPWEWRMEVIRRRRTAYGKLFRGGKAGLVSLEWYPDLANYRRDGYDFDARYEDGLAGYREKCVMDVLTRNGPTLSKDLKRLAGFDQGVLKGFDAAVTKLQMMTYITVHSFEYALDRAGRPYGWGVARYAVTEDVLGDLPRSAYCRDPRESRERLLSQLRSICPPDTPPQALEKLIK